MKFPVDRIFYINLDRSIWRNKNLLYHFKELGLTDKEGREPIRFPALDGNMIRHRVDNKKDHGHRGLMVSTGEKGCFGSHRELLLMQIEYQWEYVLYLEDDCRFIKNRLRDLIKVFDKLPEFESINLGWRYYKNPETPVQELYPLEGFKHFYKGDGFWHTHAMLISLSGAKKYEEGTRIQTHGLDWHYAAIQSNMKSYGFKWGEVTKQDNHGSGMRSIITHTS